MISGKLPKVCADQFCDIFTDLFNLSLTQHKVPKLWKESIIVPVAKNKSLKVLNDFQPLALTWIMIKQFWANSQKNPDHVHSGPAWTHCNLYLKYLEGTKTHSRLNNNFSSAFNTNFCSPLILMQGWWNGYWTFWHSTVVDKNRTFNLNTSAICKKGLQRLYFLRRLRAFNVDRTLIVLFYRSFIKSILTFCLASSMATCRYGNLSMHKIVFPVLNSK